MADQQDNGKATDRPRKKMRWLHPDQLRERRFVAQWSRASTLTLVGWIAGAGGLGAGVYGRWVAQQPNPLAPWVIGGACVLIAGVIMWGEWDDLHLIVGDTGVGLQRAGDAKAKRLRWREIHRIVLEGDVLRIEGSRGNDTLSFRVSSMPIGTAWLLKEARWRIKSKVSVSDEARKRLPEPNKQGMAEPQPAQWQVTGLQCAASNKIVQFERDARLCPQCAEVYDKDALPERCVTCDASIGN